MRKYFLLITSVISLTLCFASEEKDLRTLKPEFKDAKIEKIIFSSGQTFAILEKEIENSNQLKLHFYLKNKNPKAWIYLDSVTANSYQIKKNDILSISNFEGGSSYDNGTILWRFKGNKFYLIGAETELKNSSVFFNSVKDYPYLTSTSVNFLTGNIIINRKFTNKKDENKKCHFKIQSFTKYKISNLDNILEDLPDCPLSLQR